MTSRESVRTMLISPPTRSSRPARYLAPVIGDANCTEHLITACGLAAYGGGQVVALVIGIVPSSLPMGADVPHLWSRLEYEAARVRRLAREAGQEVETVLALSDSA